MNHNRIKLSIISFIVIVMLLLSGEVNAASSKISTSASSVKEGDTITVTISGNAASWNVSLNADGPVTATGKTSFSDTSDNGQNKDVVMGTATFKATGEGTVNFTLSGQVVDGEMDANGNYPSANATGSASVTISANNSNGDTKNATDNSNNDNKTTDNNGATRDNNSGDNKNTDNNNNNNDNTSGDQNNNNNTNNDNNNADANKANTDNGNNNPNNNTNTNNDNNKNNNNNSNENNNNNKSNGNNTTNTDKKETTEQKQEPAKAPEPEFKETNETLYIAVNEVNVRKGYTTSTELLGSLKKGESVVRTGIGDNGWSRVQYNGQTAYIITTALTSEEPQKEEENASTDKTLKELTVEGYELTPAFDPEITKYSIEYKGKGESLNITATPTNEKAKVNIVDNDNIRVGNNMVRINVVAEDGTTRMYSISFTREEDEQPTTETLKLSKLQVASFKLSPEFNPNVNEYVIETDDPSTVKKSDVVATATDANDVNVTIMETEASENGERNIIIQLESKDKTKHGTYQIAVKKPIAANTFVEQKQDNSIYIILGSIIGVLVLLILIIIIALRKTSDRDDDDDDYYEEDDEDEFSDDYDYNSDYQEGEDEEDEYEYDDMVKGSMANTQIIGTDYNVFKDKSEVGNDEEDMQEYDEYDENEDAEDDMDEEMELKKKKGKHF